MKIQSIAIVGLGLMGGSLAAVCRRKFPKVRILGISRSKRALSHALKKRWIHRGTTGVEAVRECDFVVLCTPVDTLTRLLSEIDRYARKGTLVTDVGSVKGPVNRWVNRGRLKNIEFIGAHPMAGSHEQGINAAHPGLFDHAFTFIVPPDRASLKSVSTVRNFWRKITPRLVDLRTGEHDRIVSEISHLPHAAAAALVLTVGQQSLRYQAAGFRDTTRIAQGHPAVWVPIFESNQAALSRMLGKFENNIRILRKAVAERDRKMLQRLLSKAAKRRA